jgi:hypothetical protein
MDPPIMISAPKAMYRAQDSVEAAADEAALRGTLAGALDTHNDVGMVRCLPVSHSSDYRDAPANVGPGGNENERLALGRGERVVDTRNTKLDS